MSQPLRCSSMPSREVFIQEVDRLLSVRKDLVGGDRAAWNPGREPNEVQIKLPLEVNGEQHGPGVVLTAFPSEAGKFSISLVHHVAVARLDVTRFEAHSNPLDALGRRIKTLIHGSHFHRWELNKQYVEAFGKLQRLHMAEPYEGSEKFMAALRWFCGELKIIVPHDVNIELPPYGMLV